MMWVIVLAAFIIAYEQCQLDFVNSICQVLARPTLDPDNEDPTSLQAQLDTVQLTPAPQTPDAVGATPRKFLLSARYVDENGNIVVPGPSSMQWAFDPGTDGTASPSGEITVSAFPAAGSLTGIALVSDEKDDRMKDGVTVKRWANVQSAAAVADVVESKESSRGPSGPPGVVLVEEASELKCGWGQPRAFLGAAAVGEQTINPCSLSLLSWDRALLFQDNARKDQWPPDKWATPGMSVLLEPEPPLNLDISVFVALPPEHTDAPPTAQQGGSVPAASPAVDPVALARNDVELANQLFEANRTGIRIKAKRYDTLTPTPDLRALVGADPYDCTRPVKLPADPNGSDFAYDSAAVSVYYVDRINFPPDPAYPRVRGIQCHYWYSGNPAVRNPVALERPDLGRFPPGNGPVVYISYTHHSPVTLAHELGHALGLKDEEGRLGPFDIMHNLLPDGDLGANARSHLTVGQAFRMNVWNDSYINTRDPAPPQRACDAKQPCPPAELDVH